MSCPLHRITHTCLHMSRAMVYAHTCAIRHIVNASISHLAHTRECQPYLSWHVHACATRHSSSAVRGFAYFARRQMCQQMHQRPVWVRWRMCQVHVRYRTRPYHTRHFAQRHTPGVRCSCHPVLAQTGVRYTTTLCALQHQEADRQRQTWMTALISDLRGAIHAGVTPRVRAPPAAPRRRCTSVSLRARLLCPKRWPSTITGPV